MAEYLVIWGFEPKLYTEVETDADPHLLTAEEWITLADLVDVYFDAIHNPPEGVVGVGAITYAERQLMLAQEVAL